MRKLSLLLALLLFIANAQAQMAMSDILKSQKDSTIRALMKADSLRVNKEYEEKARWEELESKATYPLLKAGKYSGVMAVSDVTEVPDPNIDYKILFELTSNNKDSMSGELNTGLVEISRVINLHIASGVPAKRMMPVIVVHGGALHALKTNEAYQKRYNKDNPNIALMNELEKLGAKFIACGQAMAFVNVKKEELLPEVKISITAQTVLSSYQLKGYVWHPLWEQ